MYGMYVSIACLETKGGWELATAATTNWDVDAQQGCSILCTGDCCGYGVVGSLHTRPNGLT